MWVNHSSSCFLGLICWVQRRPTNKVSLTWDTLRWRIRPWDISWTNQSSGSGHMMSNMTQYHFHDDLVPNQQLYPQHKAELDSTGPAPGLWSCLWSSIESYMYRGGGLVWVPQGLSSVFSRGRGSLVPPVSIMLSQLSFCGPGCSRSFGSSGSAGSTRLPGPSGTPRTEGSERRRGSSRSSWTKRRCCE